jgi:uncharacterized protein
MKIAVLGSGIAGLSAAWLLRQIADVTLFEADDRVGGHSHTVEVPQPDGSVLPIDTGFIVYNIATYPNLIALFEHLGVTTQPSDMSFSVSLAAGSREYSSDSAFHMLGHGGNLLRLSHWRMLQDLLRFYRGAADLCAAPPTMSLGHYLDQYGYSAAFRDQHLLPMAGAIWSASPQAILAFPAASFGHFFANHGLFELNIKRRPPWRTVAGGSRRYVEKLLAASGANLQLQSPVVEIVGGETKATLRLRNGQSAEFDHIVSALPAHHAAKALTIADPQARALLSAFSYSANEVWLHQDPALMPRRRRLWASWNYFQAQGEMAQRIGVSYWMNRLQSLPTQASYFVTLNPLRPPQADLILRKLSYDHPQFDGAALTAQKRLHEIQGKNRLWFCGSYCGYGFHEDALVSALAVAKGLGVLPPWNKSEAVS